MSTLKILLVSDIHCSENASRVGSDLAGSCDVVIATGDIGTYNAEEKSDVRASEYDVQQTLKALCNGHDKPVFWLPGNHDPPATFQSDDERVQAAFGRAVNVHERRANLAPGLSAMGFGGAVPGSQNGYLVWAGHPYTEYQMGERLRAAWDQFGEKEEEECTWLLLTHCGPASISTSVSLKQVGMAPIESGSVNLRELLNRPSVQQKVLLNIHGHTHDASGLARVGNVTVLNPGALVEGRYGILDLVQKDGAWNIQSIAFHTLE